jgi:uncharacterized RDD family membrane protein YckC
MERVGFLLRFFASIIDSIVLSLAVVVTAVLSMFLGLLGLVVVLLGFLFLLYLIGLEIFRGVSPGKAFLGLRIYNQDGGDARVGQLVIRYFCKNPQLIFNSILFLFLASGMFVATQNAGGRGIGASNVLEALGSDQYISSRIVYGISALLGLISSFGCLLVFGSSKMALHDRISGTAVFRKRSDSFKRISEPPSFGGRSAKGQDALNKLIFK